MFSNTHEYDSVFERICDDTLIAYLQSRFIGAVFVCSYEQLPTCLDCYLQSRSISPASE